MRDLYSIEGLRKALDPENLIMLPAKSAPGYNYPDLFISMRLLDVVGWDWRTAFTSASENNFCILTPREFVDFLNLLKSNKPIYDGNGRKIHEDRICAINDEIFKRDRTHSYEVLDTYYRRIGEHRQMQAISGHVYIDDEVRGLNTKPLAPHLMGEKLQISLDYWLANATEDGLPPADTTEGCSMIYCSPAEGRITKFGMHNGRAMLQCDAHDNESAGNHIRPVLVRDSF